MTSKNHPLVQVIRLQVTSGHAEMTEGTKDSTSFILVHISKYHLYNTNCGKININDPNYLKQPIGVQVNHNLHRLIYTDPIPNSYLEFL